MLRPLTHAFALMAPPLEGGTRLSLRPPWTVGLDELPIELRDEADRRRNAYPKMLAQGRLTADEAERHQAILLEILDDLTPIPDGLSPAAHFRHAEARADRRAACPFSWSDKVRELRRELAIRRKVWPDWLAKRRIALPDVQLRMERLEAAHWRYWICAEAWAPAAPIHTPEAIAETRALLADRDAWLWQAHLAGNPALSGYLTDHAIAWHRSHQQQEAA